MKEVLQKTAYELMSLGGDHRITIDENIGFNIYGCKPYPAYSIAYSSSTGSNISLPAYGYTKAYWSLVQTEIKKKPDEAKSILKREFGIIRQKMHDFYKIKSNIDIIFGPSGTDVEYIAMVLTDKVSKNGIHNIILGADEVGSGILDAAKGKYFSELTPSNKKVKKGQLIEGFDPDRITTAFVSIRNQNGSVVSDSDLEENFEKEIEYGLTQGKKPLLHIIHSSKTGLILPEWSAFLKLRNKYGDKIDIVVDACQARISILSVNRYLSLGVMVLLTGSKFLSGPPFSGALVLPRSITERIKDLKELPKGLSTLFGEAEFPKKWTVATHTNYTIENYGLLLRWQAALYEMNKIFRISNVRLKFVIDCFRENVMKMVDDTSFLSVLKNSRVENKPEYIYDRSPFEKNTILTLCIKDTGKNGPKDIGDAKIIHKALYSDLSELNLENQDNIDAVSIQLGQPVKISSEDATQNITLRIALSATQISGLALLDDDLIHTKLEADMKFIQSKMKLILNNFEYVKSKINL